MKRFRQPLFYTLSALSSVLVDLGLFYILHLLLSDSLLGFTAPVCTALARAVSSFYNFNVNKRVVFQRRGAYGRSMLRYYCLALPQMAASAGLVTLLVQLLGLTAAREATLAKLAVDTGLFVLSFFIQKFWVFSKKETQNGSVS